MPSDNPPTDATPASSDALPDDQANRISRRRTLASFVAFGGFWAGTYGGWRWLMSRPAEGDAPWPVRRVLRFNERLSGTIFRQTSAVDRRPPGSAPVGGTRLNTRIGTDDNWSADDYRLQLSGLATGEATVTLGQIKALPKVVQTTRLCCVEGWSTWANWGGCRLADLVARHPPAAGLPFVGLATRSGGYYVGLDLASATHEQTLLVYELDGQPLSVEHGAPLRLAIPTKYGIKNIKQPATLAFAATRPPDYWAERGYDWYSGL